MNETPLYDLQKVIQQYQTQPELLKLILTSKVEEDKRRAEEAKLRAKELDLYLNSSRNYDYPSLSSLSSLSEEEENYNSERRHSAAAAMLAMGGIATAYPSPLAEDQYSDEMDSSANKPKRRREMQAITKIVETRDFPYIDNYFWKNNGNTIQKKTGCKSTYYKCSSSNKGCNVNKTVTAKPNGEYLIKYRGLHLPECGRVERICDL